VKRALSLAQGATLAVVAVGALGGCGADPALAVSLANAARPSRLPYVVACWEKEFAVAPPEGGYVATVDFVVQARTSKLQAAALRSLEPVTAEGQPGKLSGREAELGACIKAALDQSSLPAAADSDGPGFSTASDLSVKRFRIAFVDDSAKQRASASASQANVLVGPRADRCRGLYSHDPPRDASTLYAEIGRSEKQAAALHAQGSPGDRDLEARELQKVYDAKLELGERLTLDLGQPEIPEANRKRLRDALEEARAQAKKTGGKIGCKP
jgi:hypothetical protein